MNASTLADLNVQTHTVEIDGTPRVLIADLDGGPVTTIDGQPIGALLTLVAVDPLIAGQLGTAWDLAAVVRRELAFTRPIERAIENGHAYEGRLRSQARQRERDNGLIRSMAGGSVRELCGFHGTPDPAPQGAV